MGALEETSMDELKAQFETNFFGVLKNYLKYKVKCIKLSFTNRLSTSLKNTKSSSDQSSTDFPYRFLRVNIIL
jgi:hypothetical protein